jgi:hypothetical protein
MGRARALATPVAVCVLAAVAVAPAEAETYRGKTRQGRAVAVWTAADGSPERVRLSWRAGCRHGDFVSHTLFLPPFDTATPDRFRATSVSSTRVEGGYRARLRVSANGAQAADGAWTGGFRATVTVSRRGDRVDTCRLRRDPWWARPAG